MKKILTLLLAIIINIPLFAQQGNCHIEINTEPNIEIYLNDILKGSTKVNEHSFFIQDIASGSHTLKFVKNKSQTQTYTINLEDEQVLIFKTKPFAPKIEIVESGNISVKEEIYEIGNIKIQSLPTSININIPKLEINRLKKQNNLTFKNVPVGVYEIIYTWRDKKLQKTLIVKKDATTHIMVNLLKGEVKDLYNKKSSAQRSVVIEESIYGEKAQIVSNATKLNKKSLAETIELIKVTGGSFKMGSKTGEVKETPVHQVILNSYYIAKYEVNQALWYSIMGTKPSYFKNDSLPVEQISWLDTQKFISNLNKLTGKTYRLPTEAEWEYAARGGSNSKNYNFAGSNNIDQVAWVDFNSSKKTHKIGSKVANELGIHDMSGNVLEWCSDWFYKYTDSNQNNPKGRKTGDTRVTRGGSWFRNNTNSHVAFRSHSDPSYGKINLGFRLAHDM